MHEDELNEAYDTYLLLLNNSGNIETMLSTGSVKSTTENIKDSLLAPQ